MALKSSALIALVAALAAAPLPAAAAPPPLREVMFVGNNWAGTATVVGARSLRVLKTGINLIPDKEQELADNAHLLRAWRNWHHEQLKHDDPLPGQRLNAFLLIKEHLFPQKAESAAGRDFPANRETEK